MWVRGQAVFASYETPYWLVVLIATGAGAMAGGVVGLFKPLTAYVARVRTNAGRVFEANYQPVVDEARKISARFQPEWLEPNPLPRPDSTRSRR
jgi:hypothetical protein